MERFAALAAGNPLGPYLMFLSRIAEAQHRVQYSVPVARTPDQERTGLRLAHRMPLLSKEDLSDGEDFAHILDRFCGELDVVDAPEAARQALSRLCAMQAGERLALADAVFDGSYPAEHLAECLYVGAAMQGCVARPTERPSARRSGR